MIKSTSEQTAALALAENSSSKQELANQKSRFIGQFLRFADKVAKPDNRIPIGRVLSPSRETYWQTESASRAVAISSEPDSPDMGAKVIAYRTGFTKAKLLRFVSLGSHVHAADVNAGAMNPKRGESAALLGATTILRMVEYPPAVYFGENETELTNVEPNTQAWEDVTGLVEELYAQEPTFNGRPVISPIV
jgi:hypothetical protein